MAIPTLPEDFKEFLKLLGLKGVEYLLVGGYAVSIHGYVRATNDLDIWVKISPENALAIVSALRQFGFAASSLSPGLFLAPNNVIRMGVPPIRLEILTSVSGVQFDECYAEREIVTFDEIRVPVISLSRLRANIRRHPAVRRISLIWRICQNRLTGPSETRYPHCHPKSPRPRV
jgi:hypothetical protein